MQKSNLIYNIQDKPPFGKTLIFALQQLLAIMAATIAVPAIIGNGMSAAAALFGAGAGTLIYLLFTKFKSPVFLGSSFAFLGSMGAAFAGAATVELGYLGLIIGAIFAGLVYVIIAFVVKHVGTGWISKIMPPQVIGPTVAIIGLSLAGNAIGVFEDIAETAGKHVGVSKVWEPNMEAYAKYQPLKKARLILIFYFLLSGWHFPLIGHPSQPQPQHVRRILGEVTGRG